ncbi:hypothetical protein [Streptosporangium carneum]|uniref:Uncharacterized protein n=1 Tax=Streptosporangium carneum TaxID=47481 RepID=A0A9W6HYI6_9ACTN|nr:hypothetical protein [Streptosporangium carneum]GLK08685.1 hypothetical protein GCM10017600_20900 [Streptosporangium carneum]
MTLSVVLYGLTCAVCGEIDQLWQDVMRGLIECRACGARALAGDDSADADLDGADLDGAEFEGWDVDGADGEGWGAA